MRLITTTLFSAILLDPHKYSFGHFLKYYTSRREARKKNYSRKHECLRSKPFTKKTITNPTCLCFLLNFLHYLESACPTNFLSVRVYLWHETTHSTGLLKHANFAVWTTIWDQYLDLKWKFNIVYWQNHS